MAPASARAAPPGVRIAAGVLAAALVAGCGHDELLAVGSSAGEAGAPGESAVYPCAWDAEERPEELPELLCPADHARLAGTPTAAALPANESVMFVVERDTDTLHFFDTARWRHFTFARDRLDGHPDLTAFNAEMYLRPDRRLFLGTLAHYLGPDLYAVEIAPVDKAPPELIAEMFALVQGRLGWPADLRYHPTSNALELEGRLPPGVPVVTTAELYAGASYQGMHLGRTIGRIHVTSLAALAGEYLGRDEILVVDRVPNDLPPLAGLVTGEFQTPLAHVNLLSQQRGTPNMALLGAAEDPRFVEQDGRWVELEVRADGFSLAPSNPEAAAAYWEASRPSEPQVPALDLASSALLDATELDARDTARVGGKAANFGELTRVSPALPLPTAFAVPCARYVEFMERAGLTARVDALLADESLASDGRRLQAELAALRAAIEAAPVDPALLAEITDRAHARFGDVPTRLRSSANAEDLADFNGAGLYESATWDPSDPGRPLERALRRVYASLWSFAAFQERDWARVDHRACAMGVLVHPSFPDEIEAANGVAITDNPFDPPPDGQAAYYVNVQSGATPVTNPEPGTLPESFLYYKPPAGQGEMTYFTSSSLTAGERVLAFAEVVELVRALGAIHEHFQRLYPEAAAFGMDVEFKLVLPDRALVIKQARPYRF